MLARTELPVLRYRFNAPITRDALPPYSWHYAPWTKCSAQCAGGEAGVGRGGAGPGHQADLLGRAGLSRPLARPQAARCRLWSAAISWTAQPWLRTTAAPTASYPRGSAPATQSPAHPSECLPGCRVGMASTGVTVLLGSEEWVLPKGRSKSEQWCSLPGPGELPWG